MHFGVNVRRLEGQRLGIGRYLEYLLRTWQGELGPDERMTLYIRAPLRAEDAWIERSFDVKLLGPSLTGVTWETLAMAPRMKDVDVFFGPSYSLPVGYGGRSVVAIHSLNETTPGAHPWWYHLTYAPLYRHSARKALKVIVPSQSVLDKVHEHYGVAPSRIEIVREGAPDSFAPIEDEDVLLETRRRYTGADDPYILFVGKFSERRNIPLLIRAFAALRADGSLPHNLLLVGPNHLKLPLQDLARELGVAEHVTIVNPAFTNHAEIVPLFSAADLYVFPSLFEGASNTVVEAMSCGVPVVAGRCEAIADIVEGSGMLVDDVSVDSIAAAMRAALTDRYRWQEMRGRGLEKSKTLRWSRTAKETLDILRWAADASA
jgi:glycosyltransferase involved in cell wall biosynthesis